MHDIDSLSSEEGCTRLHALLSEVPRMDGRCDFNRLRRRLIYCFYEAGEVCPSHGGDRITYVGMSTQGSRRLKNYYNGTGNFANHIFRAWLLRRYEDIADPQIRDIIEGFAVRGRGGEFSTNTTLRKRLRDSFQEAFSFVHFRVPDDIHMSELEERMITTISSCTLCGPSPDWLGLWSAEGTIVHSGMWQEQHVQGFRMLRIQDLVLIREWLQD